jgi:hypothetical protein
MVRAVIRRETTDFATGGSISRKNKRYDRQGEKHLFHVNLLKHTGIFLFSILITTFFFSFSLSQEQEPLCFSGLVRNISSNSNSNSANKRTNKSTTSIRQNNGGGSNQAHWDGNRHGRRARSDWP